MREALAQLGPFFVLDGVQRPGLCGGSADQWLALPVTAEQLVERALAVQRALGGVELRVAASVTQLGLVGRLLSPAIGAALIDGRLLAMADARWQPVLGAFPLALADLGGVPYDGSLVEALGRTLVDTLVRDLVELTAALSVSRRVLWGNVASSVIGAVAMVTRARPDLAAPAAELRDGLLGLPALSGTVSGDLRRRSCCLIWRAGPASPKALCGDCVISRV